MNSSIDTLEEIYVNAQSDECSLLSADRFFLSGAHTCNNYNNKIYYQTAVMTFFMPSTSLETLNENLTKAHSLDT